MDLEFLFEPSIDISSFLAWKPTSRDDCPSILLGAIANFATFV